MSYTLLEAVVAIIAVVTAVRLGAVVAPIVQRKLKSFFRKR